MKFYRKYLVIGIVLLFVGASVMPSTISREIKKTQTISTRLNTWIVDNEGDGDFITIDYSQLTIDWLRINSQADSSSRLMNFKKLIR